MIVKRLHDTNTEKTMHVYFKDYKLNGSLVGKIIITSLLRTFYPDTTLSNCEGL